MANILYRKQKQQKSLDNGVTWIDTGEYRVGDILENPSNCISEDSKQCRWTELPETEGYYCDGYNKYTVQVEECSENGIIWTRTGAQQRGNTVIENNASDCGYDNNYEPTPEDSVVVCSDTISFKWSGRQFKVRVWKTTSNDYIEYIATSGNSINNGNGTYTYTYTFNNIDDINRIIIGSINSSSLLNIYSIIDTSNITDMDNMFGNYGTYYMNSLDLQCFDTSKVTTMADMFNGRYNFTSLNVSNFDTSKVTDMSSMFRNCSGLTSLDLSHFNTSNVTDMSAMFAGCKNLTEIKGIENWNVSKVENFNFMFDYDCSVKKLDLSEWDVNGSLMDFLPNGNGVEEVNISNFNIEVENNSYGIYSGRKDSTLKKIIAKNCNFKTSFRNNCFDEYWNNVDGNVVYYPSIEYIDISGSYFSSGDMNYIFGGCTKLTTVILTNIDTSNVIDMTNTFRNCMSLTSLDLSNWDMTNVSELINVFYGCTNLTTIYCYNCNQTTIDKLNSAKPSNCTLVY